MKPQGVFKQAHSFVASPRNALCAICERPKIYHSHEFIKGNEGQPDRRVAIEEQKS